VGYIFLHHLFTKDVKDNSWGCDMSRKYMLTNWQIYARLALAICLDVLSCPGFAAEPVDASTCTSIPGSGERLKCYDALGGRGKARDAEEPFLQFDAGSTSVPVVGTAPATALSMRWELDPETKQGLWVIRPHRPLFVLPLRYSDNPNDTPQTPTQQSLPAPVPYNNSEAEFQLSLKTKGGENLFGTHADL
jgi:phospholipase A1/A2